MTDKERNEDCNYNDQDKEFKLNFNLKDFNDLDKKKDPKILNINLNPPTPNSNININSSEKDLTTYEPFQEGRSLLWEVFEFKPYLKQHEKDFLNSLKNALQVYHSFTVNQKRAIVDIREAAKKRKQLQELEQEQKQKNSNQKPSTEICAFCGDTGSIYASVKETIYTCVFRCTCDVALRLNRKWPIWSPDREKEYTPEFYNKEFIEACESHTKTLLLGDEVSLGG